MVRSYKYMQISSVKERYRNLKMSDIIAGSSQTTRNRLQPSALFSLLDERKAPSSRFEVDRLAGRYNIDVEVLERLVRYVNTPSISEDAVQSTRTEDNQVVKKMLVCG